MDVPRAAAGGVVWGGMSFVGVPVNPDPRVKVAKIPSSRGISASGSAKLSERAGEGLRVRRDGNEPEKSAALCVGVAGALTDRRLRTERGEEFGKAFEHYILMELRAHSVYRELDYPIQCPGRS